MSAGALMEAGTSSSNSSMQHHQQQFTYTDWQKRLEASGKGRKTQRVR